MAVVSPASHRRSWNLLVELSVYAPIFTEHCFQQRRLSCCYALSLPLRFGETHSSVTRAPETDSALVQYGP